MIDTDMHVNSGPLLYVSVTLDNNNNKKKKTVKGEWLMGLL